LKNKRFFAQKKIGAGLISPRASDILDYFCIALSPLHQQLNDNLFVSIRIAIPGLAIFFMSWYSFIIIGNSLFP